MWVDTTAFDISISAIEQARGRYPGTPVRYQQANLLDPPAACARAFDLVLESLTVQSLPDPSRRQALAEVPRLVGRGGTLLVLAAGRDCTRNPDRDRPGRWSAPRSTRSPTTACGPCSFEELRDPGSPPTFRWRAEFWRA